MEELEEEPDNPCPAWIAHRATHLFFQLSGRKIYAKLCPSFLFPIQDIIQIIFFSGIGIPSLVKLRTMSSGRRKGKGKVCFFSLKYHNPTCCQL